MEILISPTVARIELDTFDSGNWDVTELHRDTDASGHGFLTGDFRSMVCG